MTLTWLPDAVAPAKGAGSTAWGASNVLCDVIDGAVRIRPVTEPTLSPAIVQDTVAALSGFVFTRET